MADILAVVQHQRASENTIYYVLYGYFFLGLSKAKLAVLYKKHKSTISSWITRYEQDGYFSRTKYERDCSKFSSEKRQWLINLYMKSPTMYLHEAKTCFQHEFNIRISVSSIWRILNHAGLTLKYLERRAIQIKESDIIRFFNELSSIRWDYSNLLFLDEVSFDNRSMLRSRGYGIRGKRLVFRGEFVRKARVSLLCFIGQHGMIDSYSTNGTFTRSVFFDCCKRLALETDHIRRYPGTHSIWIMDGAKIHCCDQIINYLRSLGVFPIFLPAYCPFFNPIEIVFGLCKRRTQAVYQEGGKQDIKLVVAEVMSSFREHDLSNLFRKCGYLRSGKFDPSAAENIEHFENTDFEINREKRKV